MRWLTLAIGVAAVIAIVLTRVGTSELDVQRIVIRDAKGLERLSLGASGEGVGLFISDERGRAVVKLGSSTLGPALSCGLMIWRAPAMPRRKPTPQETNHLATSATAQSGVPTSASMAINASGRTSIKR